MGRSLATGSFDINPGARGTSSTPSNVWNTTEFTEIKSIVGEDKALRLLSLFRERLDEMHERLTLESLTVDERHNIAHNLRSMSGQLGFEEIANISCKLEHAKSLAAIRRIQHSLLTAIEKGACAAEKFNINGASR